MNNECNKTLFADLLDYNIFNQMANSNVMTLI